MKGTGAKRNVFPGSYVSTGAKFPVAPVESAPMEESARAGEGRWKEPPARSLTTPACYSSRIAPTINRSARYRRPLNVAGQYFPASGHRCE